MFMVLNPSLKLGVVEVVSITDTDTKSLNMVVHVRAHEKDINTLKVRAWVSNQIKFTHKYLVSEGFISGTILACTFNVGTILHSPDTF
jgi:hypothetical protein